MNLPRLSSLSIFTRVLITLLLVFTPLIMLGGEIYTRAKAIVMSEISASAQSKIHFYLMSLEHDMERNYNTKREFLNDTDLLKLSIAGKGMTEYEKSQLVVRIVERLKMLKNSSIYIKQVQLYIPLLNKMISERDWYETLHEEQYQALLTHAATAESKFITWNNRLFLLEMHPNPLINQGREPIFMLSIEIDKEKLEQFLTQLNTYSVGGAAIYSDQWIISTQMDTEPLRVMQQRTSHILTDKQLTAQIQQIKVGDIRYYAVYQYSRGLDSVLIIYTPEAHVLGPLKKLSFLLWFIAGAAVLVFTFFSYQIYQLVHQPLRKLVRAYGKVMTGNLQVSLSHRRKDEFNYLYDSFNDMVQRLRISIHEVYEQQIRIQRSELKQLQSQINPHFLYNSFYILHRMITLSDLDGIKIFTKHLGDYFQFLTRSGEDEVPLALEIKHAQSYVEIQNFRFYNRIHTSFEEVPDEFKDLFVPRLILQPIIENAYKYGLEKKATDGLLVVTISPSADYISIHVEDNGPGLDSAKIINWNAILRSEGNETEEVTAILNIHRRLRIRYGASSGVVIEKGNLGGLKVTLTIPKSRLVEEDEHVSTNDRG